MTPTALTYCEGCEAEGRTLTATGFCPACAIVGCQRGAGDEVGLPTPADVAWATAELDWHVTGCDVPEDDCPICSLLQVECPECDTRSDDMSPDEGGEHVFVPAREDGAADAVAVGCEGFVTAAVRAAAASDHVE